MNSTVIIIAGLLFLSTISGMLGLGVAFAAVPFLSFFLPDLVHQVQPLTLILNGVTAIFSTFGFAKSHFVDWPKAIILAIVTTIIAPAGAFLVQVVPQSYVWFIYLAAVIYLAFNLFRPVKHNEDRTPNFKLVLILAVPISILAGFLGIGPGFLLMPTLIIAGFEPKHAAGINSFAVAPPSFSALIPHWHTMQIDWQLAALLLVVGAIGSFAGARLTSVYVPPVRLKQMFGVLIVIMTLYKIFSLLSLV
jgi:uncharacterized membrane protein YfcA